MIRNRDAASPSNLSLDTLQPHEIASYRSGWVSSPDLTGHEAVSDATLMAELSARLLVAAEKLEREVA
jgi:hypothetical protein